MQSGRHNHISEMTSVQSDETNNTRTNNSTHWYHDDVELRLSAPDDVTNLERFSSQYQNIHGYLSIGVCLFGIVSNVMNVVVLTRRNMVTSTNYILTALAVADILTMMSYLPYAVYFYCVSAPDESYPHPRVWIVYLLFNTNFNITCHTIAMWLTVLLAVFRYIVVCHHHLGPRLCNAQRAKVSVIAVILTTVVFCIPNYVMHRPCAQPHGEAYWLCENQFVSSAYKSINFWSFGVVLKVAPCVLLAGLSGLLIRAMKAAVVKRRRLKAQGKRVESERANEHFRTTAMLVAVVLCFVVTELPQGILAFLSGIDETIFSTVYVPLGDMWDILVLINSSVNFILYCIMNRRFRATFQQVFCGQLVNLGKTNGNTLAGHPSSHHDTQFSKL